MFIAKIIKSNKGRWNDDVLQFIEKFKLGPKSGIQHGFVTIESFNIYNNFKTRFQSEIGLEENAYAIFDRSELQNSSSLLLHNFEPDISYPVRFDKNDDGYNYLRYAFGDICKTCNHIPKGEQIRPLTLAKEPNLPNKYIWGGLQGVSGYTFTDNERFKILNLKWGLQKKEVLIGANRKISQNFVQIDIPLATSNLCFGTSDFGNTFKLDGSGEIDKLTHVCPECNRAIYTNQVLDYFPSFLENQDSDIVYTQEWFGWYRRKVISRKFADWLVENNYLLWSSNFLIPVKNFCEE